MIGRDQRRFVDRHAEDLHRPRLARAEPGLREHDVVEPEVLLAGHTAAGQGRERRGISALPDLGGAGRARGASDVREHAVRIGQGAVVAVVVAALDRSSEDAARERDPVDDDRVRGRLVTAGRVVVVLERRRGGRQRVVRVERVVVDVVATLGEHEPRRRGLHAAVGRPADLGPLTGERERNERVVPHVVVLGGSRAEHVQPLARDVERVRGDQAVRAQVAVEREPLADLDVGRPQPDVRAVLHDEVRGVVEVHRQVIVRQGATVRPRQDVRLEVPPARLGELEARDRVELEVGGGGVDPDPRVDDEQIVVQDPEHRRERPRLGSRQNVRAAARSRCPRSKGSRGPRCCTPIPACRRWASPGASS